MNEHAAKDKAVRPRPPSIPGPLYRSLNRPRAAIPAHAQFLLEKTASLFICPRSKCMVLKLLKVKRSRSERFLLNTNWAGMKNNPSGLATTRTIILPEPEPRPEPQRARSSPIRMLSSFREISFRDTRPRLPIDSDPARGHPARPRRNRCRKLAYNDVHAIRDDCEGP